MKSIYLSSALLGLCAVGHTQGNLLQTQTNMAFGLQSSNIITLNGPFVPGEERSGC
jgi:hypothetical protein